MPRFSIGSRLLRRWMLLVAVLVVAVAGFAVYRLNGIFGSHDVTSTPSGAANDIVPIGCRIKIDDVVKDERTVNTLNAFTYCLDKSG